MPMDLSRDETAAGDAATAAWEEVSEYTREDEKPTPGARASLPASSAHPIENTTDSDLPSFYSDRLHQHPIQGAADTNKVAAHTNGNLLKDNTKELGLMELQSSGVDEQGSAVVNYMTAAEEVDKEKQKLQYNNLKKLSDDDAMPLYIVLASDELASSELGVMSIPKEEDPQFEEENSSEPTRDLDASAAPGDLEILPELSDKNSQRPLQDDDNGEHATHEGITYLKRAVDANHPEKDELGVTELTTFEEGNSRCLQGRIDGSKEETSHVEEPPTSFDIFHGSPAEASNNDTEGATEIPAAEEKSDMNAMSRDSAEVETVAPFAHDPLASSSGETDTSLVHAAEEATEVPAIPTSTTGETRDMSLPQEPEGNLPNNVDKFNADGKQRESADNSELPGDHYLAAHTGDPLDILDPPDILGRSSQGDSPGTKAHSVSHGASSRSREKSVSDADAYADLARIPYSGPIAYSGPISSAYSYPGAPHHSGSFPFSGSISHRSDSSAASNRSFAFPIFATDWNSSPARMAQPDRRYLRRKRRWRPSCMCCSRPSPTYY